MLISLPLTWLNADKFNNANSYVTSNFSWNQKETPWCSIALKKIFDCAVVNLEKDSRRIPSIGWEIIWVPSIRTRSIHCVHTDAQSLMLPNVLGNPACFNFVPFLYDVDTSYKSHAQSLVDQSDSDI